MDVLKNFLGYAFGLTVLDRQTHRALASKAHPRHREPECSPGSGIWRGSPIPLIGTGIAQSAPWHGQKTQSASHMSARLLGVQQWTHQSQQHGEGAVCPSYWVNYY